MTNSNNQNLPKNKQEYLDWKTILLNGEINIDKPIRDEFKDALENWQKAINRFYSDDKSKKKLQGIKHLTEARNLNLYKVIENLSKKTVNHIVKIKDKQNFSNKLTTNTYIKINEEFNKPFSEKKEISLHFLKNNYEIYNNSHDKTVAYIKRRILFYFITLINKSLKKKKIENKHISIDDEHFTNIIDGKNDDKLELLLNNIENITSSFPKILIILNRALLNDYWCIKLPGPNQITSYLLNFLIHSNLDSLFEIFNIDERVKRLIYNVIENKLRENKDRVNSEKDKIIQKLPDFNKIINNLRSNIIQISLNKATPKRNNIKDSIYILDKEDFDNCLRIENKKLNSIIDSLKAIMADKNCDPKLVERIMHNKREDNRIKVIKEEKYNYYKYFLSRNFERLINTELNTCILIYQMFYWAFFQTAFADNEETQFRQLFVNRVLESNPNGGENYEH